MVQTPKHYTPHFMVASIAYLQFMDIGCLLEIASQHPNTASYPSES